jgi:hypothetical protein
VAELVTIDGRSYLKRDPLGVLGLSLITIVRMQERAGITRALSPALNIVLLLVVAIAVGLYSQEHLNKVWDAAARRQLPPAVPGSMPPPPA